MKRFPLLLGIVCLSTTAFASDINIDYLFEVCQKAYPQDRDAAAGCLLKGAGVDGPGSEPSTEDLASLYGEPDDPLHVQQIRGNWGKQMLAHASSFEACKGETPMTEFYLCAITALDKEIEIHDHLFDSLKPPAWPKEATDRYVHIHALKATTQLALKCESLKDMDRSSCMGEDESSVNRFYAEPYRALIAKAYQHGKRARLEREATAQHLNQQLRQLEELRAQIRTHEHNIAQAQMMRLILQGFALRGGPLSNTFSVPPPTIQPPAFTPVVPRSPLLPPVSCTSRTVGGIVHTDCY